MDTRLTIRQICFTFLFLSISSIFNYIPNVAVQNAGGSGYVSVIYSCVLLLVYAALILQVIKAYPDKNIYEVLQTIFGTFIAKVIVFLYACWAYLFVVVKIGAYSVTLQATLMPSIHPGILLTVLFLLVIYTLTKNPRTIFRFSEFLYQPILIFLAILVLFAVPSMNWNELVPVDAADLKNNFYTIPDICAIGGNLCFLLFFSKELLYSGIESIVRKRVYNTIVVFSIISALSIIVSVGMNGATSTGKLSYPMFQAIKSVSVLNTFERFDSLMTMIAMLSDFVGVYVFLQLTMLCLGWLFNYQEKEETPLLSTGSKEKRHMNNSLKVYGCALFFIAAVYILIRNMTQYEFEAYYRGIQRYLNLIFQFIVPIILGLISIIVNLRDASNHSTESMKD